MKESTQLSKRGNLLRVSQHSITEEDIEAVNKVLRSGSITRGREARLFEEEFANYVRAKYAVACSSGTAALHLACMALDFNSDQRVMVPTITYAATANAVHLSGAKPRYYHQGDDLSGRPAIIMHYAGHASKTPSHGIIIEDACHALGAKDADLANVGACEHSQMACFSFHPAKHITTGEGGMVTTNDESLARRLRSLRDNGREFPYTESPWKYSWERAGLNYFMSDVSAALGRSQLRRIDEFIRHRESIAYRYWNLLPDTVEPWLEESLAQYDSFHLFPVLIDYQGVGKSRVQVMTELLKRGIETQVHYYPLHLQPMGGGKRGDLPDAEAFYDNELSLPIHTEMTTADAKYVCHSLKEILG